VNNIPPASFLREWLDYDPNTGIFRWAKEPRAIRPVVGQIAGTRRITGQVFIKLPHTPQLCAHRIAWVWCHGPIPAGFEIDHKDGDQSNNAISNLRLATSSQQKMNRAVQSNNRSGLKGAYFHACRKGKQWRSQIKVGVRLHFLGYYDTAHEAHAAYVAAADRFFGRFACRQPERLAR